MQTLARFVTLSGVTKKSAHASRAGLRAGPACMRNFFGPFKVVPYKSDANAIGYV